MTTFGHVGWDIPLLNAHTEHMYSTRDKTMILKLESLFYLLSSVVGRSGPKRILVSYDTNKFLHMRSRRIGAINSIRMVRRSIISCPLPSTGPRSLSDMFLLRTLLPANWSSALYLPAKKLLFCFPNLPLCSVANPEAYLRTQQPTGDFFATWIVVMHGLRYPLWYKNGVVEHGLKRFISL